MPVSLDTWLAYAAATVILLVIPGPTILTVISYSLTHGRRANVALVAGVALGDSTALVLSLVGLGAVLAASAAAVHRGEMGRRPLSHLSRVAHAARRGASAARRRPWRALRWKAMGACSSTRGWSRR